MTNASRLNMSEDALADRAEYGRGACCPSCGYGGAGVIDTRRLAGATRRRRMCRCGTRFTTYERVEPDKAHVDVGAPLVCEALEARLDEVLR